MNTGYRFCIIAMLSAPVFKWTVLLYIVDFIVCCLEIRDLRAFLPRDALLSAVYAVVVCLCVCVCVCLSVCHTPVLYQNG